MVCFLKKFNSKKVTLITGPVKSGKTTILLHVYDQQPDTSIIIKWNKDTIEDGKHNKIVSHDGQIRPCLMVDGDLNKFNYDCVKEMTHVLLEEPHFFKGVINFIKKLIRMGKKVFTSGINFFHNGKIPDYLHQASKLTNFNIIELTGVCFLCRKKNAHYSLKRKFTNTITTNKLIEIENNDVMYFPCCKKHAKLTYPRPIVDFSEIFKGIEFPNYNEIKLITSSNQKKRTLTIVVSGSIFFGKTTFIANAKKVFTPEFLKTHPKFKYFMKDNNDIHIFQEKIDGKRLKEYLQHGIESKKKHWYSFQHHVYALRLKIAAIIKKMTSGIIFIDRGALEDIIFVIDLMHKKIATSEYETYCTLFRSTIQLILPLMDIVIGLDGSSKTSFENYIKRQDPNEKGGYTFDDLNDINMIYKPYLSFCKTIFGKYMITYNTDAGYVNALDAMEKVYKML